MRLSSSKADTEVWQIKRVRIAAGGCRNVRQVAAVIARLAVLCAREPGVRPPASCQLHGARQVLGASTSRLRVIAVDCLSVACITALSWRVTNTCDKRGLDHIHRPGHRSTPSGHPGLRFPADEEMELRSYWRPPPPFFNFYTDTYTDINQHINTNHIFPSFRFFFSPQFLSVLLSSVSDLVFLLLFRAASPLLSLSSVVLLLSFPGLLLIFLLLYLLFLLIVVLFFSTFPSILRVFISDLVLDCSPPTKSNRVHSLGGSRADFCKWESCRTLPLVSGFSQGSPVFPALSFWRCSILTSITLIGSQDLAVKSRPNLFTHSLTLFLAPPLLTTIDIQNAALEAEQRLSMGKLAKEIVPNYTVRWGKREYPEKTRRQAASSSTIPTARDLTQIVVVGDERPSHCATAVLN
ncbi:hypothetical protein PR048_008319 [Dryococelus australis]|uniref:Uncharacterized protein n=1 Tax=Dryococelus australis TaxID=614101 RepID=A0ABQ9HWS3_9NEOP|nr:hypothetical protein PR048_008319 [Dryococelus australis]